MLYPHCWGPASRWSCWKHCEMKLEVRNKKWRPVWLRELIRVRFASDGNYDDQYEGRADVYNVTNDDLLQPTWELISPECNFCQIPMKKTPWQFKALVESIKTDTTYDFREHVTVLQQVEIHMYIHMAYLSYQNFTGSIAYTCYFA